MAVSKNVRKYMVFIIAIAFMFLLPGKIAKASEENRIIRVGFPIQEGLTLIDENGSYSGYTYDYLKEVAQYTGWTYEFVRTEGTLDEQLVKLMKMLEEGEIDLLGAMNYSEGLTDIYDFPSENYGNAYSVIAVKCAEDRIDEYNLPDYKGLRIALINKADNHNEDFYQYAKLNGIQYEAVWCEDDKEQFEKMESGEADAMLSIDLALPEEYRPIAKFSPMPFYFATTKGNTRIVNELNQAITYISEINPTLQTNLYNKYFSRVSKDLILNNREIEYIQAHPVLKVLVHDGFGPLQYYDNNKEIQGVACELLGSIAEEAGWQIEYLYTDTYEEYEQALFNKEADVILTIQYDYDTAIRRDILLSIPYLETESVLVTHEGVSASSLEGKKEAVYKGARREGEDSENILYYDSMEDSLEAVEDGECDYTYTNSYTASFYQRKNRQEHTVIYPQTGNDSIKYSIGILNKDDKMMSAIFNKGINSIDANELEHYIYDNAQQDQEVTLLSYIRDNTFAFLGGIVFIAALLLALLYKYYRTQMKMKKQIELENTRYRYLSDILKEMTFTYDYERDVLLVFQEGVKIFDADEKIVGYSRYHSKLSTEEKSPSMYELLMEKKGY